MACVIRHHEPWYSKEVTAGNRVVQGGGWFLDSSAPASLPSPTMYLVRTFFPQYPTEEAVAKARSYATQRLTKACNG